ncbi:hypothetical protein KA111_00055 [Candidatus Woesebacteria bacterium]|nr:hypothetical protein [Candidatus Woesebacteria bacterium]
MYKDLFAEANMVKNMFPNVKAPLSAAQQELMRINKLDAYDQKTIDIILKLQQAMKTS